MAKVKKKVTVTPTPRKSTRIIIKKDNTKLYVAKKQPNGLAKRKSTALPRPSLYGNKSASVFADDSAAWTPFWTSEINTLHATSKATASTSQASLSTADESGIYKDDDDFKIVKVMRKKTPTPLLKGLGSKVDGDTKKNVAKKQPNGLAKRKSTALPGAGLYGYGSSRDLAKATVGALVPYSAPGTSKAAETTAIFLDSSSVGVTTNCVGSGDIKAVKLVMKKVRAPIPRRPPPEMDDDERLTCYGLNDYQINGFLSKTGWKDVVNGWGCAKKKVVTLKAGFQRLLLTPDSKHYAIPSSMTNEDWGRFNEFRQWGLDIFIFVTREYCIESFVTSLRGNAPIPTDADIVANYAYETKRDANGAKNGWQYKSSHTALMHIKGNAFKLYDVNNNNQADWDDPSNDFVHEFYDAVDRFVLPRLAKNLKLDLADVRRNYMIPRCYFPLAVDNSCVIYLLFILEQTADEETIWDVNFTPSLAQLYYRKVVHHVGGGEGEDFDTFTRNNPDWLTVVRPFLFENLLTDVKTGIRLSLASLREEMERIDGTLEYEIQW